MTTDQIIKICQDATSVIAGDASRYDSAMAGYARGMIAMAYFQGNITFAHYETLNKEVDAKLKGE